jgi:rhodanese-related sulfurtransferase
MKKNSLTFSLLSFAISATFSICTPSVSFAQQPKPKAKVNKPAVDADQVLNTDDFQSKMDKTKGETVIDLRKDTDYKFSHLDGAVSVPFDETTFAEQVAQLDKSKAIFLYSQNKADKKVTSKAIIILEEAGATEVYYLDGGFELWNKKHKPVFVHTEDPGTF